MSLHLGRDSGLENQRHHQQQLLRLHSAPPHLRPLEDTQAPAPQRPAAAHFSQAGDPWSPGSRTAGGSGRRSVRGDRQAAASGAESNGETRRSVKHRTAGAAGGRRGEATGRVAPGCGRQLTRRARCVHRAVLGSPAPAPSGIVCSTPTYLRSRLRLRVEAHAELLDGTRKHVVRFGSGPEEAGRRRLQSGRRAYPAPCSAFPVTRKASR